MTQQEKTTLQQTNKNKQQQTTTKQKPPTQNQQKANTKTRKTKTPQRREGLGEVGPKGWRYGKIKITEGDLKDNIKQETKKKQKRLMKTTFEM